jgi:hypothetical protein
MANRYFKPFMGSFDKGVVMIHAKVAIGGTGAPTLSVQDSFGVASISRTGAGAYTLTLNDKYQALLGANVTVVGATGEGLIPQVTADTVATTKTVGLVFIAHGGSAADPTSGDVLHVQIWLRNSAQ